MSTITNCLAIAVIILGSSFSLIAQEHTERPRVRTPSPAPSMADNTTDSSGWVRFTSEPGRFSVLMPEMPGPEKVETKQSTHGPYTNHLFILRTPANIFTLGWVDYDPNFNFDRRAELEANRDNFVKGMKGNLMNSRTLTIEGYEAIEFTVDTADWSFKSRVYMVGRRPYQIIIGSRKHEDDSVSVNRFLNSFKVSPK